MITAEYTERTIVDTDWLIVECYPNIVCNLRWCILPVVGFAFINGKNKYGPFAEYIGK